MTTKFYLIRKNMEKLIGPVSQKGLKNGLAEMEFGLQDEVASSCKPWVSFEDQDMLKLHYPELIPIMKSRSNFSLYDTLIPTSRNKAPGTGYLQRRLRRWLLISSISIATGFFAFVLAKHYDLPFVSSDQATVDRFHDLYISGDREAFIEKFAQFENDIAAGLAGSEDLNAWLPYIRIFAFQKDGAFRGVSADELKGQGFEDLPKKCTYEYWTNQWERSRKVWEKWMDRPQLIKNMGFRILLWDRHWYMRRNIAPSWIEPASFYEACLSMATRALKSIAPKDAAEKDIQLGFLDRLTWLKDGRLKPTSTVQGVFPLLTCLEKATSPDQVSSCPVDLLSPRWRGLGLIRQRLNLGRVLMSEQDIMVAKPVVESLLAQIPNTEPGTGLDWVPEKSMMRIYLESNGDRDKLKKAWEDIYPGYQFSH